MWEGTSPLYISRGSESVWGRNIPEFKATQAFIGSLTSENLVRMGIPMQLVRDRAWELYSLTLGAVPAANILPHFEHQDPDLCGQLWWKPTVTQERLLASSKSGGGDHYWKEFNKAPACQRPKLEWKNARWCGVGA